MSIAVSFIYSDDFLNDAEAFFMHDVRDFLTADGGPLVAMSKNWYNHDFIQLKHFSRKICEEF